MKTVFLSLVASSIACGQAPVLHCGALDYVSAPAALSRVESASYPELGRRDVRLRAFRSSTDFLQTRFSIARFLLPLPMRYFIEVNPAMFDRAVPEVGLCAILAHELGHVVELGSGNRLRRIGLVRLLSKHYTAGFERRTDLVAIERGYAQGLIAYRRWVYQNIPASSVARKRENYFTPEEIELIDKRLRSDPTLAERWRRHVPRDLAEARK